jgi:hypothetical protein
MCTGYMIADPILVLQCSEPPTSTPLTIAGLPVVFVPDMRGYDSWGGDPGNHLVVIADPEFNVEDSQYPTFKQVESTFCQTLGRQELEKILLYGFNVSFLGHGVRVQVVRYCIKAYDAVRNFHCGRFLFAEAAK